MIPKSTREMEPHIKQRYFFASSAFSRIYGVDRLSQEMLEFSHRWAETTMPAPTDCLHSVDRYFAQLWKMNSFGKSLYFSDVD